MVKMEVELQQQDKQQRLDQVLENVPIRIFSNDFFFLWFIIIVPESATSLIFFPSVFAINPITENITNPLIKQVASLKAANINVSLDAEWWIEFFISFQSKIYR